METSILELLELANRKEELALLSAMNQKTERFGLALRAEDIKELAECRNQSLKKYGRVEFGRGILDQLIYVFCDSQYISQQNYLSSL